MRRLALFAFITVAFCPPIGMLLMLAYAALTGGLGRLSFGAEPDADQPLGRGQPVARGACRDDRSRQRQTPGQGWPVMAAVSRSCGVQEAPRCPSECLSALTRTEAKEGVLTGIEAVTLCAEWALWTVQCPDLPPFFRQAD